MAVTIILFVSMYMAFPITYVAMWFEGKPKETTLFGVTIKKSYLEDERVKEIQRRFRKETLISGIIIGIIPFSVFFINYFSIVYTILVTWVLVMIVATTIPFIRANSRLMKIKRENGWGLEEQQITYIDTEAVKIQEKVIAKGWFIASCVISILPVITDSISFARGKSEAAQLIAILSIAASTFILSLVGISVQRSRGKVVSKDSAVNAALNRMKKYQWAKAMAVVCMTNALYTVYLAAEINHIVDNMLIFLTVTILYMLIVIVVLIKAEITVCNVERKIFGKKNEFNSVDDDQNWIYGTFYYNKNDSSTLVDKRVGIGWTCNFAKKSVQIAMGFTALLILLLPFSSVWMMADEFVPISCEIQEQKVIARQYKGEYEIPLNDVRKVELLTDRPLLSKTNGTSLDTVMKGSFYCSEYGSVKVCLRPQNKYFLVVTTDSKVYILNDENDEDTLSLYNKIKK